MRPNGGAAARRGGRAKITKNTGVTLKRLFSYIFKNYKGRFVLVIICILLSAVASVASSMFIKTLIDTYIEPLIGVPNPGFSLVLLAGDFNDGGAVSCGNSGYIYLYKNDGNYFTGHIAHYKSGYVFQAANLAYTLF